ncbi:MAG: SUMF1/EgtB/PvdO family nonheme iron enzyme [Polyangiaceae bacterium]|nr:SUMF1/EgtB/PvdO family nonheme iron enzyme [Polyangiaceae bacterium]
MRLSAPRLHPALLPLVLAMLLPLATMLSTRAARAEEGLWPSLDAPPKPPAKAPKEPEGAKDFVLLVAIEDYAYLPDVVGARSNASDWFKWMTEARGVPTRNIELLINEKGTPADLEAAAAKLVARSNATPGGTFWLIYIGHGAPPKPGSGQKSGLLVGVNAQQREVSFYRESLDLDGLLRTIESGGQRETVAIVDACFSGRDAVGGMLMEGLQAGVMADLPPVRAQTVVLSAAAANQYAGRLPGERRPAFSYLVLGGLRGWADAPGAGKGQVTAKEIEDYTRRVLLDLSDVEQTPEARGKVDVVLTRAATEAAPALAPIKARLAFGGPTARATELPEREAETRPITRPAPKAQDPVRVGRSEVSVGEVDLGIDVKGAKAREALAAFEGRIAAAQRLEQDASRRPEDKAGAWDGVAADPIAGQESAKATARENAAAWRGVAGKRGAMRTTWAELSEALGLRTLSVSDKKTAVERFIKAYDALGPEPELGSARAALETLRAGRDTAKPAPAVSSGGGSAPRGYVRIEPGRFTMGSPSSEPDRSDDETAHEVRITRAFYLKTTEVTQGEWQAVMGSNPSHFSSCGDTCPVENITWWDAIAFVNKLSDREGLTRCYGDGGSFVGLSCNGYRLPTEAEWEYAARAGTTGARYGSREAVAWFEDNSGGKTRPVGGKQANAWGLYDMLGNVWEWVHDWKGAYDSSATDPTGPSSGDYRVVRGGSWDFYAWNVRAADRYDGEPGLRVFSFGLRPARSVP